MEQCFRRKCCNILDMLHLTAYKYRSLVQQSKETIDNSEICELNSSERVRVDSVPYLSLSE